MKYGNNQPFGAIGDNMRGFIYRMGTSIKEWGETARVPVFIKLGLKLRELV